MTTTLSRSIVMDWLDTVKDPEIPVLSIVDLGVITDVKIDGDSVAVELTPTFTGCPALEVMKNEVKEVLVQHGVRAPSVSVSYREPWSSDKISSKGRAALQQFGLAPPGPSHLFTDLQIIERAECPRCHGLDTELRNTFGPTLCRSIHYCNSCREAFEQFKAI
jgi:ring-1,2-phenylacetyl-CoA epoxidase subunit PaaD